MTTATNLLEELDRVGVLVEVEGQRLVLEGPDASLTDEIISAVRAKKSEILALLSFLRGEAPWTTHDEYQAAFLAEHDAYVCPRCSEPVLLESLPSGRKRYTDWFNGRPHMETCEKNR